MKKNTNRFPAVIFIRIFVVCVFFLKLLTTSLPNFFHVTVHKCVRIVFWRQYIKIQQQKRKRMKNSLQSLVTYSFFCLFVGSLRCVSELNFAANYFLQQQLSFNISFRNLLRKIRWSPHLSFFSFLSSTRPILRVVCVKLARQERSYDDVYCVLFLLLDSDELSATHGWFDSHTELGGVRGANLIVTGRRGGIHNR